MEEERKINIYNENISTAQIDSLRTFAFFFRFFYTAVVIQPIQTEIRIKNSAVFKIAFFRSRFRSPATRTYTRFAQNSAKNATLI